MPGTLLDDRFSGNPLVLVDLRLRLYAGVLLEPPDELPFGMIASCDADSDRVRVELVSETRELILSDANSEAELREKFIGVLGHDLRTPLKLVRAGGQLLSALIAAARSG